MALQIHDHMNLTPQHLKTTVVPRQLGVPDLTLHNAYMDLSRIAASYVERLVEGDEKAKILLLDRETTGMVSLVTTQSTLLKNDVFLTDRLDNPARQKMRHLNCIAFVRPCSETINYLVEELRVPRYASYSLVFSNVVRNSQLERLAEADDHEAVSRVQEMFCDFFKINRDFFTSGASHTPSERALDSLLSVLLSTKLRPEIVHDANSPRSKRFARELSDLLSDNAGLFDGAPKRDVSPLLLVLDRLNDPLTPLLTHWTYQAMVDELIGITNNRVDLTGAPEISPDQQEIVLAQDQDSFFAEAMYLNFGDLGAAVREYVQHYQSKSKTNANIDTVADMKRFVEDYPEFRRLGGNVAKHVALVGELSRIVDNTHLLAVSELEQSLACNGNHQEDLRQLQQMLANETISALVKYRLVALYGLRYVSHPQYALQALCGMLDASCPDQQLRSNLEGILKAAPQEDLFNQGSILLRAQQGLKGLRGVENVFTQHKPLLESLLGQLTKGRLPRAKYPVMHSRDQSRSSFTSENVPPENVVIFILGGVTYEEARLVGEFNKANPAIRVILGGTEVTNSRRVLEDGIY